MPDRTFTHCKGKLFYFMSHENEETNYRKIKIEAFINYKSIYNCSSKQCVARCHMDVPIKIEIGNPY